MLSIYDIFAEDFAATFILFVVLLLTIPFLVTRGKSVSFFKGLLLAVGAFFASPVVYFKRALDALADYPARRKTEGVRTKQYLLEKLTVASQALLVILAVALLATGFVSAWIQLVPSKQLRASVGDTEEGLQRLKAELAETEPKAKQMEEEWSAKRAALVGAYESERSRKTEGVAELNNALAIQINAGGDTAQQALSEIRSYHAQNEYIGDAAQYENVVNEISGYIHRQPLAPEMTGMLVSFNNNWYAQMLSRFETRTLSENQLKLVAYPALFSRLQRLDYIKGAIPAREEELVQLRAGLRYDFGSFVLQIVLTIVIVLLFVWALGLFIDWIGLGVDVAAYVQKNQGAATKDK